MENDRIERQYQDSKDLVAYLMEKSEVSFATYIDSVFKNQMIISKNPQFTGISARQQLEFTTHLLLTD